MIKFGKLLFSISLLACLSACIEEAEEKLKNPLSGHCDDNIRTEMLSQVNEFRAHPQHCGNKYMPAVPPLEWDNLLYKAAYRHASDMAKHNFLSHTGSDGSSVGQRVGATGAPYTYVGENIFAGKKHVHQAMQSWQQSPGHCENIMRPHFNKMAAACVKNSASDYTFYWAQVFSRD